MPFLSRGCHIRHAKRTAAVLGLLAQQPLSVLAQSHAPPPYPYADYSPPMATVLVVVIGLFITVGFLSVFFRHFTWCLGLEYDRGGGGEWRRDAPVGLDSAVVDSFPKFLYSEVKVHRIGKGTLECAICLTEFNEDDVLQMLPVCSHVFHPDCIGPWLESHVTCPVCRANLEFQQRRQHFETLLQQLQQQLSDDESELSDQNQLHHEDDHRNNNINREVIVTVTPSPNPTIKSPVQEIKDGGGRRGKLPRSHSTGHSLAEDSERFTLRLPEEVHNKLVNDNNQSILPAMISPPIGYRSRTVGCAGLPRKPDRRRLSASPPFISRPGSLWSPKSDHATSEYSHNTPTGFMSGPRNLLKSIKSPLNRGTRAADIGERSSDRLWPNRPPQDLELEGQQ